MKKSVWGHGSVVRVASMGMGVQTPENPSELGSPLVNAVLEVKDRELL